MSTPDPLKEVRSAAKRLASAAERRDHAIADAVAEGHSLRAVADAANLSHVGVAKIAARVAAQ